MKYFSCSRKGAKDSAKFKAHHVGVSHAKPDDDAPSGEASDATDPDQSDDMSRPSMIDAFKGIKANGKFLLKNKF